MGGRKEVSISAGKSIAESVGAAGLSLLERPLSCSTVSRTLGTYRKWGGGGKARRGCSPLPITSSDIQANILPLPVTSSPLCLFPSRLQERAGARERRVVCVREPVCARPSIPGEYSRDRHVEKGCRRFCEPNENSLWPFSLGFYTPRRRRLRSRDDPPLNRGFNQPKHASSNYVACLRGSKTWVSVRVCVRVLDSD